MINTSHDGKDSIRLRYDFQGRRAQAQFSWGGVMTSTATAKSRILVVDDDRGLRLAVATLLEEAGYAVVQAADGPEALARITDEVPDVMLLDVGMPGMSGLDVLAQVRSLPTRPRVVVMTADDTPETLLSAIRGQADRYIRKPFAPGVIVEVVEDVVGAATALPIEVVSARPEWVELVAPCTLEVANRIHAFMMQFEAHLPEAVRESVGQAFRELLSNAVEWGGRLDPTRKVRISYLRARRMLLYRIADPGEGFDIERLTHAAINNPEDNPLQHAYVREAKGLRAGGLGLAITRSLVDELIYNEARNEVVFVKYLD
jgi:CheY-like chemotaxis protein/anti-sigma regulatory factor (Ser/Thr protein kinase)